MPDLHLPHHLRRAKVEPPPRAATPLCVRARVPAIVLIGVAVDGATSRPSIARAGLPSHEAVLDWPQEVQVCTCIISIHTIQTGYHNLTLDLQPTSTCDVLFGYPRPTPAGIVQRQLLFVVVVQAKCAVN